MFGLGLCLATVAGAEARPSGDELANEYTLFEPTKLVDLASDGSVGQNTDCVLEGSCREEAIGVQGGLGDAQYDGLGYCGLAAFLDDLLVELLEIDPVYQLAG